MARNYQNTASHMYKLENPPQDAISDMEFGQAQRILVVASWDGILRWYEFNENYSSARLINQYKCVPQATSSFGGGAFKSTTPTTGIGSSTSSFGLGGGMGRTMGGMSAVKPTAITRLSLKPECDIVYFGVTNGLVYQFHKDAKQPDVAVDAHGQIVGLKYIPSANNLVILVLSEQSKVIICDPGGQPPFEIPLPYKPIGLDFHFSNTTIFFATLGGVFKCDITKKTQPQQLGTQLEHQITSIAVGPDMCYVCGSVSGKIEIISTNGQSVVSCHRNETNPTLYSSNSVAIIPNKPVAISAGGDGTIVFLNCERGMKGRELKINNLTIPLTCVAVSTGGEVAAIAQGYDWSRGAELIKKEGPPPIEIYIKKLVDTEFG